MGCFCFIPLITLIILIKMIIVLPAIECLLNIVVSLTCAITNSTELLNCTSKIFVSGSNSPILS
jgi:hypothetical protein